MTVTLTPAKRDVYTAGVSYGTDSGAGVRLGWSGATSTTAATRRSAQID